MPGWVRSLGQAARRRWVWLGAVANLLIVFGSLTPAYLPQNSPWWRPIRQLELDTGPAKIAGTVLVMAGLVLLLQCWLNVRHLIGEIKYWAVLVIWSLPLLSAPPIFSHDAYSYAAQGWLIHNDLNPYEWGPGALPGPFADQSPWVWRFTKTPYGPLSLVIQHALVRLCGNDPYLAALSMRIPALVGVVLIAVFIPRIARLMRVDEHFVSWFAVLNPLLILDFVGGAHNDAHMTGLFVLGIWVAYRYPRSWGLIVGAACVGVAASIKQPAFLAAYAIAFIHRPMPDWGWKSIRDAAGRVLVACGTAIGVFVVISLLSGYGFGWKDAMGVPGTVVTISPFTLLGEGLQYILNLFHLDPTGHNAVRYSRTAGMVLAGLIVIYLAVVKARRKPMTYLAWSFLAVAFCSAALHGWYVMWGAVILPLTKPSDRVIRLAVWASVLLLSYAALNFSQRNNAITLGVAALVLCVWQVTHFHRRRPPQATEGSPDGVHAVTDH